MLRQIFASMHSAYMYSFDVCILFSLFSLSFICTKVPPISTVNSITIKSENISSGSSASSTQQKSNTDSNGNIQINGFDSAYYSPPKSTTTKTTTVSASPSSRHTNGNSIFNIQHPYSLGIATCRFFLPAFLLLLLFNTFFFKIVWFRLCRYIAIAIDSHNTDNYISSQHTISYQNYQFRSFCARYHFWLQPHHPNFME